MSDPPEEITTPIPSLGRRKRNCLIFLLLWAIVAGFVFGAVSVEWETPILILDMIVFLGVIVKWTYLDAEERDFTLWRYFVPLTVICPGPIFMMPVYFIRSRGWGRGLIACVLAFVYAVLQFGLDYASTSLALKVVWGL